MKKPLVILFAILSLFLINSGTLKAVITKNAITIMLSNEAPGYLIDNLIANGYGDSSLYSVLVYLAPHSEGVIRQSFLDTLRACPAGSEIFTEALYNFSHESNNPIGISSDGTLIVANIYGRDYFSKSKDYKTAGNKRINECIGSFTYATEDQYNIYVGALTRIHGNDTIRTTYKAFAIAWGMPVEKTFILSNEAPGYLIDKLISAGLGDSSLYTVLVHLEPISGGAIRKGFLDTLKSCPDTSDIFTVPLYNFSDISNNPIGISSDGTIIDAPIYGKEYYQKPGYNTHEGSEPKAGKICFTSVLNRDDYMFAGTHTINYGSGKICIFYHTFAIAWAKPQENDTTTALTFMLSNEAPGYLIDNLIANGYGDSSLYSVLVYLAPHSGGVIRQSFLDTLKNCPSGSEIFTAPLSSFRTEAYNPIGINSDGTLIVADIYGKDYFQKQGYSTFKDDLLPLQLKLFTYALSLDHYIDAGTRTVNNVKTVYKAFAIAWSRGSTVVLSNEAPGYLIDTLITKGYGDKNLFEVISALQPVSGGSIPENYVKQLGALPQSSEIFTAKLDEFAGNNNPVLLNADGSLMLAPVIAKDYFQNEGYKTYIDQISHLKFTHAENPEYYIDAGKINNITYFAFNIIWLDNESDVPEIIEGKPSVNIFPNPFREGIYISNIEYPAEIEIFDILSRNVYSSIIDGNSFIPLSPLQDGMYLIKLRKGEEVYWQVLIRQE